ncbi:hypothetical protein [Porphyromonas cangingivalis]|nr:hypothetical protein [Porphyromonas cangingivalis]
MNLKPNPTITCGCCGHKIPRPSFARRNWGDTITCPVCKNMGIKVDVTRRTTILLLIHAFVSALLANLIMEQTGYRGFLPFFFIYLIVSLPTLILLLYLYEPVYKWPNDIDKSSLPPSP